MNMGGVIKGGLLAGLIINISEGVLNGLVIADQWEAVAASIGLEQPPSVMAYYVIGGFVIGILGVWLYAAVRPRLGAGPATAATVGLLIWFVGWLWPFVPFVLGGVFPAGMMTFVAVWALIELPVAVMAGAWLYSEDEVVAAA